MGGLAPVLAVETPMLPGYTLNRIAYDDMTIFSDDPDAEFIRPGDPLNLSGPDLERGWSTGWVSDLAIMRPCDDEMIYDTIQYNGSTFNGISLRKDPLGEWDSYYITNSVVRGFADGHKIDFDADGKVYFLSFLVHHTDAYGATYVKVDFGGKFSVTNWIRGGNIAVSEMFADFGSDITSDNTGAYVLPGFVYDTPRYVTAMIVTSADGADRGYFKFFGQQDHFQPGSVLDPLSRRRVGIML